jgi:exonuclease SbcC
MIFSPESLSMKDFMSHSESIIDFSQFNSALIVGQKFGDERISNATGKSTIFKAISFVLFDQYPANKSNIVRDDQKICEVIFDFKIDNCLYRIKRRKSNKSKGADVFLYRFDNNEWISEEGRTNAQTEEEIQKLIKINYESFKNSVLFEQGTFSELLEATPAKKREILKKPLNLAIYSKFEENIKAKTKKVDKDLNDIQTKISLIGNPEEDINLLNEQIDLLKNEISNIEKERTSCEKQLDQSSKEKVDLEKLLAASDNSELVFKINQVSKDIDSLNSLISKFKTSKINKTNQLQKINDNIESSIKESKSLNSKLESIQKEIDDLKNIELRFDSDISLEIEKFKERESKGIKHIGGLETDIAKFSKPLPHGESCPVCFNELSDEYRNKISNENLEKISKYQANLEKSRITLSNILENIKKLNAELKQNSNIRQKISSLENSDKKICLSNIESLKNNINSYKLDFAIISKEIEDFDVSINESADKVKLLESNKAELEKQMSSVDSTEYYNKLKQVDSLIQSLKIKDKNLIESLTSNKSKKAVCESKIETREKDKDKLKDLLVEKLDVEKQLRIHLKATKAFSSSGIPNLIVQTILDDIQVEANKILLDIRPELSLKFIIGDEGKDTLDIIYTADNKERHVELLSGGQKMYYSFALKLGMSFVLQKRLGVDIRMLQLDEVDQPIDEAGRDAYVDIIKKYHNKMKILVVTHNNRLKNQFSNAILVENFGNLGSKAKVISI